MERARVLEFLNKLKSQLVTDERTSRNHPVQKGVAPVSADDDAIERNGAYCEGDG